MDATELAVESMPRNASIIRDNAARSGLTDTITIAQQAVGAERGELLLHSEPGGVGNAAASSGIDREEMARHDAAGGQTHVESVAVTPLDDLVEDGRAVSLIKIDVEGFEFDVLAGARRTVSVHRPVICTEISPAWLRSREVPEASLHTWLNENGYRCFEVHPDRAHRWSDRFRVVLKEIQDSSDCSGVDLLLVPAERGAPGQRRGR